MDVFLEGRLAPRERPSAAVAVIPDPQRFTAMYWCPEAGLLRRIEARDGRLYYGRAGGGATELVSAGPNRLRMPGQPTELEWMDSAPGQPRRMRLHSAEGSALDFEEQTSVTPTEANHSPGH